MSYDLIELLLINEMLLCSREQGCLIIIILCIKIILWYIKGDWYLQIFDKVKQLSICMYCMQNISAIPSDHDAFVIIILFFLSFFFYHATYLNGNWYSHHIRVEGHCRWTIHRWRVTRSEKVTEKKIKIKFCDRTHYKVRWQHTYSRKSGEHLIRIINDFKWLYTAS